MKTNFNKLTHLILTTGNDRIIAIIKCKAGLHHLKDKLIQSISENFDANQVILQADITIVEYKTIHIFKANIYSDGESTEEYFKLTNTPIY
jgi:hypothetical protein